MIFRTTLIALVLVRFLAPIDPVIAAEMRKFSVGYLEITDDPRLSLIHI